MNRTQVIARGRRQELLMFAALAVIALLVAPNLALAQGSPFQAGAETLVEDFLAIATPVAIIAVMVLAVIAMTGRISWGWPIGVLVGIGVIFGAPTIVEWAKTMVA